MPEATETAVIVPVGAAEAVVATHRSRLDIAASWGVPAHITILYPFVPPAAVDDGVVGRLTAVFTATSAFDCTFARCGWFGRDVLWVKPEPDHEFRRLTNAVVDRFPDYEPYGGEHDDVVPHLTVGERRGVTLQELEAAEVEVSRGLPITARIDHALLIAGTDEPDSWHTLARLPFGAVPTGLLSRP